MPSALRLTASATALLLVVASSWRIPTLSAFVMQPSPLSLRQPLLPLFSTSATSAIGEEPTQRSDRNIEAEMDHLSSKCKPGRNVIFIASQVEQLYHAQSNKSTHSLNMLLKVWQKTTAILADGTQEPATLLTNSITAGNISSSRMLTPAAAIAVYTARDAAEHVTKILLQSDKDLTETTSYNVVIDAWAKSNDKDAPHTAERLLRKLLEHDTLTPDAYSYHGILEAWSQSQDPDALRRLQQIYKHMVSANLVKNIRTFNSLLSAYAKHISKLQDKNDMIALATEAHELLQQEKERFAQTQDSDQQPDAFTYSIMIDIFGRCGVVKSTLQAESLLTELKELYSQQKLEKLLPNVRTYTSLISAWSKTKSDKAAVRGEELLQEMLDGSSTEMKPNQRTYAALCTCWARSQDPTKATRVLTLVRNMKQQFETNGDENCKPSLLVYNSAIDACSRCCGDDKQQTVALKIAFAMNKALLLDGLVPDAMTFDRLMQATAYLMPNGNERNGVACALLDKAKNAGCVSFDVVKNFRKAVDNNVVHEQLKEMEDKHGQIDYNNVPRTWAKNLMK